jgi:uncharacterized protein YndB with AHSA1/START domain
MWWKRVESEQGTGNLEYIQIDTEIDIKRSQQEVFNYVTTAALWHMWHPATVEVRNVPHRPLTTGETMLEFIAVAGRRDQALWTVVSCVPPQSWEISTDTPNGTARITYTLTGKDGGCRFHRTLTFRSKRLLWRLLDATLTRWMLVHQSAKALQNLKVVLEEQR